MNRTRLRMVARALALGAALIESPAWIAAAGQDVPRVVRVSGASRIERTNGPNRSLCMCASGMMRRMRIRILSPIRSSWLELFGQNQPSRIRFAR